LHKHFTLSNCITGSHEGKDGPKRDNRVNQWPQLLVLLYPQGPLLGKTRPAARMPAANESPANRRANDFVCTESESLG